MLQNPHVLLTFHKIDNPLHLPRGTTSEHPKVVRTPGVFNILTSKCASRHNGVHSFDIANFQKWSDTEVFCAFWTSKCASRHNGVHSFDIATSKSGPTLRCFVHFDFAMCFAPQRRAIFSSLIWPDGSAPAALASLLFDPPEPQFIGKTQCFATFLPFRPSASSFF